MSRIIIITIKLYIGDNYVDEEIKTLFWLEWTTTCVGSSERSPCCPGMPSYLNACTRLNIAPLLGWPGSDGLGVMIRDHDEGQQPVFSRYPMCLRVLAPSHLLITLMESRYSLGRVPLHFLIPHKRSSRIPISNREIKLQMEIAVVSQGSY